MVEMMVKMVMVVIVLPFLYRWSWLWCSLAIWRTWGLPQAPIPTHWIVIENLSTLNCNLEHSDHWGDSSEDHDRDDHQYLLLQALGISMLPVAHKGASCVGKLARLKLGRCQKIPKIVAQLVTSKNRCHPRGDRRSAGVGLYPATFGVAANMVGKILIC